MVEGGDIMNKTTTPVILVLIASITLLGVNTTFAEEGKIPTWFKTTLEYYIQGITTDEELINSLEFLIDNGIIQVSEKKYDHFSKENFSETGGFNPEWLEGERTKILQNCVESRVMGFENAYCEYVQ